jgi:hypothetical protein
LARTVPFPLAKATAASKLIKDWCGSVPPLYLGRVISL